MHLKFKGSFNQPVDYLPLKLKTIIFSTEFDQKGKYSIFLFLSYLLTSVDLYVVDNLPSTIEYIIFGEKFNQTVYHLPPALKKLVFGRDFDQPGLFFSSHTPLPLPILFCYFVNFVIVDNLPTSLTHVVFGYNFDHTIDCLPSKLIELYLGK